ncbi:radical SAM protein [Desulfovibrio sp. OttesenSCG-928-C14]|nr:radical SAM protein [Desulfovibrio sp. OttesenSCG-928-C14]
MPENAKTILKNTQSLCPVCLRVLPASLAGDADGHVYLERSCPEHGFFSVKIWDGCLDFHSWQRPKALGGPLRRQRESALGCPYDCGICPAHRQHGCTVLFEITTDCNLRCPVCFASAGEAEKDPGDKSGGPNSAQAGGPGEARAEKHLPTAKALDWLRWMREEEGEVVLQLSGGEPTLHPDLPTLVSAGAALFPAVQLNSNGLLLAADKGLAQKLKQAGLSWVFLQFDGTRDEIYRKIRGRDLLAIKEEALARCAEAALPVVLVPTLVRGVNDGNLGEILDFALKRKSVRGIHIQPMAGMGRNAFGQAGRITLPETLLALSGQSKGRIRPEQASIPGCEHERCSFHLRYRVRDRGGANQLIHLREESCCSAQANAPTIQVPEKTSETCCGASAFSSGPGLSQSLLPGPAQGPEQLNVTRGTPLSGPCSHKSPAQNQQEIFAEKTGGAKDEAAFRQSDIPQNRTLAGAEPEDAKAGRDRAVSVILRSWGRAGGAEDAQGQGQDEDPLSRFIRQSREQVFSVTCMAFQDAETVDLERLRGCCVHVFDPPDRLVPFCSYNLTARDGRALHRQNSRGGPLGEQAAQGGAKARGEDEPR